MTRPFGYDLNQIPYDYTVEVRNRFKGLDLIECLKNYGQRSLVGCSSWGYMTEHACMRVEGDELVAINW